MQTHSSTRLTLLLVLLLVLGTVALTSCVAPPPAIDEAEQAVTVEAIQTRVVEIRESQTAAPPTALAAPPTALAAPPTALAAPDSSPTAESSSGAVSVEQASLLAKLKPQGDAPELFNETWLNSDPLKLSDLRGQVVIVEFWTYG